jgi:transcriptional regulator with XRE-family HTH domain
MRARDDAPVPPGDRAFPAQGAAVASGPVSEAMARKPGPKDPQPVDAYVGARIRFRRNLLGISQTEMAEKIGVTFQQVQKYEKGTNRIGISRLMQICNVLDVTPEWLLEGAPEAKAKPRTPQLDAAFAEFQADNLAPRLLQAWGRLPRQLKRSIVTLMTALADAPPK